MKRTLGLTAVAVAIVASAATLYAQGPNGNGFRARTNASVMQQQQSRTYQSVNRPADSQRRDGTFLVTGTTANGSTTRPGNGKGLMDGSRLSTTTP